MDSSCYQGAMAGVNLLWVHLEKIGYKVNIGDKLYSDFT